MTADPAAVYTGLVTPLPPKWAPVNGARGSRRVPGSKISVVVLHTWESPEDDVARYLRQLATPALPGSGRALQSHNAAGDPLWLGRDGESTADPTAAQLDTHGQPIPWTYGPGYLCIADGRTGEFHQTGDPDLVKAFSNPPINDTSVNICLPGRSSQTRDQWLDTYSRNQIRAAAAYIMYAHRRWGVALHALTPAELKAGMSGYCGHRHVTAAYGPPGGHTDPGPNFPWDVLADEIAYLTGDDMATLVQIYDDHTWQPVTSDLWLINGGEIEACAADRAARLVADKQARWPKDGKPGGLFRSRLKDYRLTGPCLPPYTLGDFLL